MMPLEELFKRLIGFHTPILSPILWDEPQTAVARTRLLSRSRPAGFSRGTVIEVLTAHS
jgi:hypothetical protein